MYVSLWKSRSQLSQPCEERLREIYAAALRVHPQLQVCSLHSFCHQPLSLSHHTRAAKALVSAEQFQVEVFKKDVEDEANNWFHRMYTKQITVQEVIDALKAFKASRDSRFAICFSFRLLLPSSDILPSLFVFVFPSTTESKRCMLA